MKPRALVVVAALLAVASAQAAPSDRKAASQLLFDQARALEEAGNHAEACPKFAESLKLDAGLGTMLWLADCYEMNGQLASAWAVFLEAAGAAAVRQDPREKVARARAKELEPRLSRLKISIAAAASAPDLEVRRDDAVLAQAEWGLPVPVDAGEHVLRVTAPGKTPWTRTVMVRGPGLAVVDVPALTEPAKAREPVAKKPAELPPVAPPAVAAEPRGQTQRTLAFGLGGVGLVAIGVGSVLGGIGKTTYDASNAGGHCLADNRCDTYGLAHRADASSEAKTATIVFAGGLAAIAGGVTLLLTAPHGSATAVRVSPIFTASGGGVLVGRSW